MRIEAFLQQSLLFEVARASRSFDRHLARMFHTGELTFLAALVLVTAFFEHPEAVSPSRLADVLCTNRSNISHCISALEAKGFIQRRIDPNDARSFHLFLRPQGKKCAMQVIRALDKMQRDFEVRLGIKNLKSAMDTIRRAEQICAASATSAPANE